MPQTHSSITNAIQQLAVALDKTITNYAAFFDQNKLHIDSDKVMK